MDHHRAESHINSPTNNNNCTSLMMADSSSSNSNNNNNNLNIQTLSLRVQKKVLGKMASRGVAKHFISDTSARVLDNMYRILKDYYSKKDAEKVVKNIVKMTIKLGVLIRNEQFSGDEMRVVGQFQQKFRSLMMTVISFHQVDFSYDRNFLSKSLDECQTLMQSLVRKHLSEKSSQRVSFVFQHVGRPDFVDSLFRPNGKYSNNLNSICDDLTKLMDEGEL